MEPSGLRFPQVQSTDDTEEHTEGSRSAASCLAGLPLAAGKERFKTAVALHPGGTLSRVGWLEMLVRTALRKYATRSETKPTMLVHASEAVERLCRDVLLRRLPPQAFEEANHFRALHCYVELTSDVLRKHLATCRDYFGRFAVALSSGVHGAQHGASSLPAASDGAAAADEDGARGMLLGGWLRFVAELVDAEVLSLAQAKHIFLRARLRTCAPYAGAPASERHVGLTLRCHLDFTDFLEALVRLATTTAFPTDDELRAAGADEAHSFLRTLSESPSDFRHFVEQHTQEAARAPRQPAWRCVQHLLHFLRCLEEEADAESGSEEEDQSTCSDDA